VLVPAAEAPDLHPEDAHRLEPYAWDASDGARQDATDAADHLRRAPSGVGAERSAGLALDAQARDAWSQPERRSARCPAQRARLAAAAVLCTQVAARSAEQSCAALAAAADQSRQAELLDEPHPRELAALQRLKSKA
jgi:hypothetical protein